MYCKECADCEQGLCSADAMLRTFFDTESYYDTLTIGGKVFSGSLYCIWNDLVWEFLLD